MICNRLNAHLRGFLLWNLTPFCRFFSSFQQKKAKVKPLVLPDVPGEEPQLLVDDDCGEDVVASGAGQVDIDFPSTSTSEEVPVIGDLVVVDEERNLTDSEKIMQEEELSVEATAPSAPVFDEPAVQVVPEVKVQPVVPVESLYPNLQAMQIQDVTLDAVVTCTLKPFNRDQQSQFYRVDAELGAAEAFEQEFLTRELEEHDQCVNHPLYQLLQRYAKARADLSLNLLEFDALRRRTKTLANELWLVKEQTFTGTDTCGDGKLLRASYQSRSVFYQLLMVV